MKTALTVLLVLILAAEAIVRFQMRKLINSWEKDVENDDKQLTDEEVHYVETRSRLMGILGATALVIFLLRFVIFDLFPPVPGLRKSDFYFPRFVVNYPDGTPWPPCQRGQPTIAAQLIGGGFCGRGIRIRLPFRRIRTLCCESLHHCVVPLPLTREASRRGG